MHQQCFHFKSTFQTAGARVKKEGIRQNSWDLWKIIIPNSYTRSSATTLLQKLTYFLLDYRFDPLVFLVFCWGQHDISHFENR